MKEISELVKELEIKLNEAKKVEESFPDAKMYEHNRMYFSSKVNSISEKVSVGYDYCEGEKVYGSILRVEPYVELEENVRVYSSPSYFICGRWDGSTTIEEEGWEKDMKESAIPEHIIEKVRECIKIFKS